MRIFYRAQSETITKEEKPDLQNLQLSAQLRQT